MDDVATTDRPDQDAPEALPRCFLSRRVVLAGVGAAGVTLVAAGCSTYGDDNTSSEAAPATPSQGADAQPSAAATSSAAGGSDANAIATLSEIPVGGGKIFADKGVVVVQPTSGQVKAYSVVCPHQGCKCDKITETIDCPCHGSKFSLKDGSRVAGPAQKGLDEKQVSVSGQNITLA